MPFENDGWTDRLLRSAVYKTHVLRSRLVMDYTTSYFPLIVLGYPLVYSEIDHLHLSSEAQCVSHRLPLGDCHSVSGKGPHDRLKPFMVFQPDPVDFNSWQNPSQAFTEKQVSYPQLTATVLSLRSCSIEIYRGYGVTAQGFYDLRKFPMLNMGRYP